MSIAYALRAEYDGTVTQVLAVDKDGEPTETQEVPAFSGGVIAIDLNRDLNVATALADGKGRIVADDADHALVSALDAYPALKRVAAGEPSTARAARRSRNADAAPATTDTTTAGEPGQEA